jgi:fucose 4-O-acetylase-like acetyltransferase
LKLFSAAAKENNRTIAMSKLRTIEHIAYLTSNRDIVKYEGSSELPFIVEKNGSSTLVIYADHIHWTKKFSSQITAFTNIQQLTNIDILGYSSLGFKKEAKIRDIIVNELNQ